MYYLDATKLHAVLKLLCVGVARKIVHGLQNNLSAVFL